MKFVYMRKKALNLFTLITSFFAFSISVQAQVPNLGTAANFVLFTTNGAVTNTGSSQLTGHVGSNVGGSTGFGNVDGVMHDQVIIQIEGTLNTNASSKVNLQNGAQACNVFWKVEGAVGMSAGTKMRGTIVAHNAAISMNVGDTLEGRALSINGAIGVDGIFAYTPLGCSAPILTGPNNPILATTECFVFFAGIGPVTNVGVTSVTGDVGSNDGLTTGFDSLLVEGIIHPVPDGATAQCASDFSNVYNNISSLPYDIELLYPAQFGDNLILTPHIYLMNAAVTFTDSLFLNA